jgi:hypothetical protein
VEEFSSQVEEVVVGVTHLITSGAAVIKGEAAQFQWFRSLSGWRQTS